MVTFRYNLRAVNLQKHRTMLHLWPQPMLLLKKKTSIVNPFCDTLQSPFSTHGHRLSTGDEKNNVRWHQQKSHLTTCTLFELSGNSAAGSITNRCTIDQPLSAMLYLLYGTAMIIPKRHCIGIYLLQSGHTLALLVMSMHSTIVTYKNIKNASCSPSSNCHVMPAFASVPNHCHASNTEHCLHVYSAHNFLACTLTGENTENAPLTQYDFDHAFFA